MSKGNRSNLPTEPEIAARLVERIQSGDESAKSEMVERYQNGLTAMLFNRARNRDIVDEVSQNTWVIAIDKIRKNELRDPSRLAGFLVQTGKNQLIMKFRSEAKRQNISLDMTEELPDKSPTPEENLRERQRNEAVRQMLSSMNITRDREILKRFYLNGDSKKLICADFKLSGAHFDRVLYRARNRFKAIWTAKMESE